MQNETGGIMKNIYCSLLILALSATQGWAETVVLDGKTAKKMLFSPKRTEFVVVEQKFMTEADISRLNLLSKLEQFRSVYYYGAIAVSPKHGLAHKATVATSDYHSPEAAGIAALKECNSLRGGGPKCVVVAQIVPKKYVKHALQLSATATAAFRKIYTRAKGPKTYAISPTSGHFSVAKGNGSDAVALANCNKAAAKKGREDCKIVVKD